MTKKAGIHLTSPILPVKSFAKSKVKIRQDQIVKKR